MAVTRFKDTTYNLTGLLNQIDQGTIGLPDIQRPFVWTAAKVRDLFDSMYKGFPIGYLLFWSTGAEAGAKQIGTSDKQAAPQQLIVDGQQRLTSLYAVITGTPIITKDYTETRIRIAFRPSDQTFEVTDAAIERDPEFIPDISVVFEHVIVKTVTGFMNSEGGVLLTGVADNGEVLGLNDDYSTLGKKPNSDGYELFLRELIDKSISGPALGLIRVSFETLDNHEICRVNVGAEGKLAQWADPRNSPQLSPPQSAT